MIRWQHTSAGFHTRLLLCLTLLITAGCAKVPELDHPGFDHPGITVLLLDENGALMSDRNGALATGHAFLAGDFLRVPTTIVGLERGELNPDGSFVCRDPVGGRGNGGAGETGERISFREAFHDPCRSVFREIQRKIPWADFEPRLRELGLGSVSRFGDAGEDPGFVPEKLAGEGSWDIWGNRLITASPAQMARALHLTFAGEGMTAAAKDEWGRITAGNDGLHGLSGRFDEEMLGYRWVSVRGMRNGTGETYLLFIFALTPSAQEQKPDLERYAAEWFGVSSPIW